MKEKASFISMEVSRKIRRFLITERNNAGSITTNY
jgi:hypothetical protein